MLQIFRKLSVIIGVVLFITLFILGFLAYFVSSTDGITSYDGIGRKLTNSPWLVRLIFGEEKQWVGWKWFVIDMVIFWSGVVIGFNLISFGIKEQKAKKNKGEYY